MFEEEKVGFLLLLEFLSIVYNYSDETHLQPVEGKEKDSEEFQLTTNKDNHYASVYDSQPVC